MVAYSKVGPLFPPEEFLKGTRRLVRHAARGERGGPATNQGVPAPADQIGGGNG